MIFGKFFRKKTGRDISEASSIDDIEDALGKDSYDCVEYNSNIVNKRGTVYDVEHYEDIDKEIDQYISN